MKQYSIRQYVAFITLVQMIVIAVCLEAFFLNNYFTELDAYSVERAKLLASQLGSSSEYGVVSNNQLFLQYLAQGVALQQDVRGVAIQNQDAKILAVVGQFSSADTIADLRATQTISNEFSPRIHRTHSSLLIYQSILPQTVAVNELEPAPAPKAVGAVILEISMERAEKFKSKELWYTVAATAIFLILSGYIVNIAIRRIVQPINKLSAAIQTMGQGNLDARAAVSTNMTEVGVLSHGINQMAEQLQHERAVLQQRVDDATLYIRNSKERAEQATLSKSKFLAAASHDLRQPIHAQGLFLDVLSRTDLTERQRTLLANARAASDASSDMINTLLDYSRIEAGVINTQMRPFSLQPLFHKLENELAPLADKKGLLYRTRETGLVVNSDPALVEVILRNLVSNAIRYTERGGLLVACRSHGQHAVLEVWDTGMGIPLDQQQQVFREFHQLGNPERDRQNGLGLGLAIAQGLARTLKDELTVASIPHRGSVFRFKLPLANLPEPIELPEFPVNISKPLNARVLVIDDDASVRIGMCHLLTDWGCQCDVAESIEEALVLARANAPDVVISDYRLRDRRTGFEAISALRAMLGTHLPVLLITGDTTSVLVYEAQAGDIQLLLKPVAPGHLFRNLVELLRNHLS